MQKTVIIITGPTASGKTALSLQLAEYFNTSIISADSRQCFNELNIGVAKPTYAELNAVKHYFINSHSINKEVNAQIFEKYALDAVEEIFVKHDIAIMVGGTGLYIKAFCEGLDEIPTVDEEIRKEIISGYNLHGIEWLQNEIKEKDPFFWAKAEQQNPQRLMRGLEVFLSTQKSITAFRKNKKIVRPFKIIKLGIELSKEKLIYNIDKRTDEMISLGLEEEVRKLIPLKDHNALQTVGYSEFFDFFDGKISFPETVDQIKIHTRQYAKRQMTWFKKDIEIEWLKAGFLFSPAIEIIDRKIE